MATFWDIGTIEYITPVLIFVLVFVIIYAIMQKTKLLGGSSKVDFMVALVLSLVALVSENTVKLISVLSGWYVLLLVAIILITLVLAVGAKGGDSLVDAIPKMPTLMSIAFYLSLVILVVSISHVFGPVFQPYSADADPSWWALRTIFNPKVVGTVLIMLIALVVISKLTKES
ncbi:hypothetical protein J4438_01525 [Candidatus Woesearchaeota archaeon]|nr:hypothetical protein [Candidatus Woesearchaeota archaeon]